jgi:4'-phosphopantetheinyl transferase
MHTETYWTASPPDALIAENEVHIWSAGLEWPAAQQEVFAAILSADEVERSRRYYFEKDRQQYSTARGILRILLGAYLGVAPQSLTFGYTPYGKPFLAAYPDGIQFNLSHSGGLALFAFSRLGQIGIDVEHTQRDIDMDEIAQRFFSLNERRMLDSAPESARRTLFFQLWTRKEAVLKAAGMEGTFPLDTLDVSTAESPAILPGTGEAWHIQDILPAPGFRAAIATGEVCIPVCRYLSGL